MKRIIYLTILCAFVFDISAQTIRKPWSELTSSEKAAYVNAIKNLSVSDVNNLANEHQVLFGNSTTTGIHIASRFLPWHRIFIRFFEDLVQAQNPDVTLPYWDWWEYSSWTSTSTDLFDDASGGSMGLFGYNIIESGSPWNYDTRTFDPSWSTTPNDVNLSVTSVTSFSDDIEISPHNGGHTFIEGTMDDQDSPGDPMFYLHHCMVDKVWADWFRIHNTSTGSGLDTNMETFLCYNGNCNSRTAVDATDWVNPRDQKLWYAHEGVLLLDLYETSGTEVYYYTTGSIEAENFTVKSSSDIEFRTNGEPVYLNHDFEVETGATFAIIIN